ncbi:MAG: polysaccharide biosynthesis protein [Bacteroidales bacterium]|nr:polysaccharide biosynthesis protein [Bacteroidales bacterium]MBD5235338.1 polysaccharide biosynthesis protein [Barnesiella sp.]
MKDTAIYGVSSIVGRFLNWCLVPMYTYLFPAEQYGIVTNLYAYVALVLIILLYGMETGFFRFANHERWNNPTQVYSTTLISVGTSSLAFVILGCIFSPQIARVLNCADHPSFIWTMVVAVGLDAYCSIAFSYLRYKKKPVRFATLKFVNIGLNIGLNLFFLIVCPWIWKHNPGLISWFYVPDYGIGYIFLANLLSSIAITLLLIPELRVHYSFNSRLWREMVHYSFPLLILGIAGIMNQTIDKILLPFLIDNPDEASRQLGIYGANYKIAIVMVMFIQAFRFAYEPFIFDKNKESGNDKRQAYADAMKFFVIFGLFIFLGVMFYLDVLKYFISPRYFAGLRVVPIVMAAEFFFGIFFNLSLWYKLTDKTIWGTWFSLGGLAITLIINIAFVPAYGYMACAWAAFCCYGAMMTASYIIGQKKYPINYDLPRLSMYILCAAALYAIAVVATTGSEVINFSLRTLLLAAFGAVIWFKEKPLARATAGK